MPEHDSPENFDKKPIESMPAPDSSEHFREIDENDPFNMNVPLSDDPAEPSEPSGTIEPIVEPLEIVTEPYEPMPSSYESSLTPAPFTNPSEPMPDDLKELDDEDDWNEPEGRLDEADMYDEDEDEE